MLEAFLSQMSPMHRAKAEAALQMQVRVNGAEFMWRHALIEARVAGGSTIETIKIAGKLSRVLQRPDGAFFDEKAITKTGMDYAAFILNKGA